MSITKIRKAISFPPIILSVLLIFLIESCSKQTENTPRDDAKHTRSRLNRYTDEEIFRGVILCHGPLTSHIPINAEFLTIISNVSSEQQAARNRFCDQIVQSTNNIDPNFIPAFAAKMRSDNLYDVSAYVDSGRHMLYKAGAAIPEYSVYFKASDSAVRSINYGNYNLLTETGKAAAQHELESRINNNQPPPPSCVPWTGTCFAFVLAVAAVVIAVDALAYQWNWGAIYNKWIGPIILPYGYNIGHYNPADQLLHDGGNGGYGIPYNAGLAQQIHDALQS